MAAANISLLRTLTDLWRTRSDASITIDSGRIHRTLHIQAGNVISADSDVLTERLGVLLVAEGKLDVSLVEPVVRNARASGRFFGAQLVADGLLSAQEISVALERQASGRFERALQMIGDVELMPLGETIPVMRRPVASIIVSTFRSRMPIHMATSLVASLPPSRTRIREDLFTPEELQLDACELRYWRQLNSGQDMSAVLDRAPDYDVALRLMGALVALGAMGAEQRDPIEEALRSA